MAIMCLLSRPARMPKTDDNHENPFTLVSDFLDCVGAKTNVTLKKSHAKRANNTLKDECLDSDLAWLPLIRQLLYRNFIVHNISRIHEPAGNACLT